MKKRKIKLFASVASLAMVAAVMGVGVWAATTQSVGVSSTVSFTGTSIAAQIALGITGQEATADDPILKNTSTLTPTNAAGATVLTPVAADADAIQSTTIAILAKNMENKAGAKAADVALVLEDGNGNGYIDAGSYIEYTFTITPQESTDVAITGVTVGAGTNTDFNYAIQVGTSGSYGADNTAYTAPAKAEVVHSNSTAITVKVKFTAKAHIADITGTPTLGDITIAMKNYNEITA